MDYADVVVRALKTFVQAFLAAWAVTGNTTSKEAVLGAVAAAVSAVWNVVVPVVRNKVGV